MSLRYVPEGNERNGHNHEKEILDDFLCAHHPLYRDCRRFPLLQQSRAFRLWFPVSLFLAFFLVYSYITVHVYRLAA